MDSRHFEFGPFALDADRGVLTRDGAAVDAGHRAVLLLQALLRAEGRAVTKAELMDAAWPGRVVEESNLSVQVAALRKLLGDSPAGRPWIATIARVGYRFDGPVSAARPAPSREFGPAQGAHAAGSAQVLPAARAGKTSIVVLPLVALGGGAEDDYLVDGITEDIIVALTRFRWFHVIGRNSSFAFKGRTIGSQQVARELGVRYALEGSVRMSAPGRSRAPIPAPVKGEGARESAQQVRITAQLIDAATAHQLWAERFELGPGELGRAQDTIAQRVAGAIEPELLRSESALAALRAPADATHPGGSATAWELVHRGAWHFHQVHRAGHLQARELFRQACAVDPGFAPAHLWLARVNAGLAAYGWTEHEADDLREGLASAFEAIHRDEKNAYTHYGLAIVSAFTGAFEQAIRAAERAVELNPSFALGHLVLGMALVFSGDAQAAIGPLEHGLAINPGDPQNFVWFNTLACALLFSGQPLPALGAAERALKVRPDWRPALETAVCCAAALGDAARYGARLQAWRQAMPVGIGDALAPLKRHNPRWAAAMAAALAGDAQPLQGVLHQGRQGGFTPSD